MSFLDWVKEKKKEEGKSNLPSSNTSSAVEKFTSPKNSSFLDWVKEDKAESPLSYITEKYNSILDVYKSDLDSYTPTYGKNSYTDARNKYSTQANELQRLYKYIEDNKSQLGDDETISSIYSNVEKILGGYNSIFNTAKYYSQFENETAFKRQNPSVDYSTKYLGKEDFEKYSTNRNYVNPTRDDLRKNDVRMDASTWYTDFSGTTYNAYGEKVEEGAIYGYKSDGPIKEQGWYLKNTSVADPYGLWASTDEDERRDDGEGAWHDIMNTGNADNWDYLNDDEIGIYYYLLGTEGSESANKFLDDMAIELNKRYVMDYQADLAKRYEEASFIEKIFMNVGTVVTSPMDNLAAGIEDSIAMLTGDELNPYSVAHQGGIRNKQIRSMTAEDLDELTGGAEIPLVGFSLGDAYQAGMSGMDSMVGALTNPSFYATQMGIGAFSDKAGELYLAGADMDDVTTLAITAGVSEGLFERVSVGNLIKMGDAKTLGQVLKNTLIQGGVEASEEMATELTNIIADGIVRQGESNWAKMVEEANGDWTVALAESARQVAHAGLSGFIAGGMSGGTYSTASYIQHQGEVREQGQTIIDNKGYDDLKKLAIKVTEEASGVKGANKLNKAVQKADAKTTPKNVGRLSEQVSNVQTNLNTTDVKAALVEQGMTEHQAKKATTQIMEIAEKQTAGVEITPQEWAELSENDVAYTVYQNMIFSDDSSVTKRNTAYDNARNGIKTNEDGSVELSEGAKSRISDKVVHEVVLNQTLANSHFKANTGIVEETEVDEDGVAVADTAMTAEEAAQYKGKTTYTNPDTFETTEVKIEGIAKIEDGQMMLKLDNGETVNAQDIRFSNESEALVYSTVLDMGVNAGVAEALVNNFSKVNTPVSAAKYALGIREAYNYGKINMPYNKWSPNSFAHSLEVDQRKLAYEFGLEDGKADAATRQKANDSQVSEAKKKGTVVSKKGNVIAEDGVAVNEETGEIDESGLTEMQKANLVGIKALAEVSPINFHIFQSKKVGNKFSYTLPNGEVTGANGIYYEGTNDIWIDLNAGDNGEGTMLWTAAHEISHYIRERSPAKWKAMADFILKEYSKHEDISVSDMLERQTAKVLRRDDASSLTDAQINDLAYEELVSDALSGMLVDGTVVESLAKLRQENKSLWQTIKDAIADLLKRWGEILGVYEGKINDAEEAQALEGMQKAYKKLQKMYAEAFAEANAVEEAIGERLAEAGITVDEATGDLFSVRNIPGENGVPNAESIAKLVSEATGRSYEESLRWVQAEFSIANIILGKPEFLDFDPDTRYDFIKKNSDYPQGTVDPNNLCRKREEFTVMFDMLQRMYPNKTFTALDVADMRHMLDEEGITVACGACFVEDRRQLLGEIADTFIGMWKEAADTGKPLQKTNAAGVKKTMTITAKLAKAYGLTKGATIYATDKYIPNQYDLTTYEGFKKLEREHPMIAYSFIGYNNSRGQQAARLIEGRAEYTRQILNWSDKKVQSVNNQGGLRIFSFSDFQAVSMLDIIQVIIDCSAKGVKIQGYTKVPEFAKLIRSTGIKINRSLMPKGDTGIKTVNGKKVLDYDTKEGIDINDVDFLDESDNPNVGNILVGINAEQISMAFLDDFVDYIIPFHTNKSKAVCEALGLKTWQNYKVSQHERDIASGKSSKHNVNIYTQVIDKYNPTNKVEFVNAFLQESRRQKKIPRYAEFLNKEYTENGAYTDEGGNFNYTYREGYHKLLVDFKMFDKQGNILLQGNVTPDMDTSDMETILQREVDKKEGYKFPQKVFDRIQDKYGDKPTAKFSVRNIVGDSGTNYGAGVYLDSELLTNLTEDERVEMVKEYIKELGGSVVTAYNNGNPVNIRIAKSGEKFENANGKFLDVNNHMTSFLKNETKQEALALAEELLVTARFNEEVDSHKPHGFLDDYGNNAWDRWYTYLEDKEGFIWEATLHIANTSTKEKILYEVHPIKKVERSVNQTLSPLDNKISQKSDSVKSKNSERNNNSYEEVPQNTQLKDALGRKLSPQQLEYFAKSVIRDAKGRLLPVYHGTKLAGFTVFNKSDDIGYFFARSKSTASTYSRSDKVFAPTKETAEFEGAAMYEVYLDIQNPLIIEAKGALWNALEEKGERVELEINCKSVGENGKCNVVVDYTRSGKNKRLKFTNSSDLYDFFATAFDSKLARALDLNLGQAVGENGKGKISGQFPWDFDTNKRGSVTKTRDIVRRAVESKNNYDGVIFKNIVDPGSWQKIKPDDVYVVFNSNQVKSVNNTEPTKNPDIRYQDRNLDSNRSLLANALETTVQNELEKQKLEEYKAKIDLISSEQQKLAEINAEIRELSFSKGKRDTEKLKSLRFDAVQTANRINTYDRQLFNLESTKVLKAVLQREKGLARKRQQQKDRKTLAEYKAKTTESFDKRDSAKKLRKLVLDTVKWVSYPKKDDVKIPDFLRGPYADFLENIDLSSKRLLKGGEPTQNDDRISSAMNSLATAIEQIKAAQNPNADITNIPQEALASGYLDLPVDFVPVLRNMAETIKKKMVPGEYVVNNMTSQEVKDLSKIIKVLNHSIREMSTMYSNLRFAHVEEAANNSITYMEEIGATESTNKITDFAYWDNGLPYYVFKRFGDAGTSILEELMDGQDKLAFLAEKIFNFKDRSWTDKEAKKWGSDTHTINLPSGNKVVLTTADAMSIYALSRREQAVPHLLGGGIKVIGADKATKKASDSRTTLTQTDLNAIISSLSDRQKSVAEAIQNFMSTECAEWGNEISMKRFLTNEFREKNYFPIESSDENLPVKDKMAQQADLYRLLNISATKPLTKNANNAVVIRNIFEVFTNHASDMAKLNAYGMALLDYMKWVNYRESSTDNQGQIHTRGLRQAMNSTYGDKAFGYVLGLIKDVNGRYNDGGDHPLAMGLTRAAKTAMVGNSIRVAALQATSYVRASAVLSTSSLLKALKRVPQISKARKYSGIALWKSFGFYDTNIARSIEDQIKGSTNIRQKIIEMSLKGAEWGDAVTWGALWNACEYEVAKNNKKVKIGTEEFNQAVANKLREVIYTTQVVDSVLTRSPMMRNKSGLTQSFTAFMSEPTVSANMLMDAEMQFKLENRKSKSKAAAWRKTKGYIGKAVAVYSIGQLTTALVESLVDAFRDDDDEEYWAKFSKHFRDNAISDLVPYNKLPYLADVTNFMLYMGGVGYYNPSSVASAGLEQAVSAYESWSEVIEGNTSETAYSAIYDTVRVLSSLSGIAAGNQMRDAIMVWNNTAGAYDSTFKVKTWENSDADNGQLLYKAIVEGNDRQAESLKKQFDDEDAVKKALVKALRENDPRIKEAAEARYNGDMTLYDDIALEIERENNFDSQIILKAIESAYNDLKPDEGSSGMSEAKKYKSEDIINAIANGDSADVNIVKEYVIDDEIAKGKTKEEAEEAWDSDVKSAVGKYYKDGNIDSDTAKSYLKKYTNISDDDIYWTMKGWDNEDNDDYSKYSDFLSAVETGRNLKATISTYLEHGVTEQTLATQITTYYKPIYRAMSNSERAGLKGYLLNAYALLGKDRAKKSKDIDKWLED